VTCISFFKAPIFICEKITKLWGWGCKIVWINWKNICKPEQEGGFRVRRIENFNNGKMEMEIGVPESGL